MESYDNATTLSGDIIAWDVPTTLMPPTQTPASQLPCFLVNNASLNSDEQCQFIVDNDCLEGESMIDYVYIVYCEMGTELRYLSMALVAAAMLILFLALGALADEFLCPSLLAVAKNLRMSDSLAGVTLLAFGNGCPDIFSSLAAASSNKSELIVGELLGAGIFCTSIVAGLIFINCDFKLARRPTLRDTIFYLFAVYLVWLYSWNETITFYGALAFILIYVLYLTVALSGQAIHSRLQGNYAIAETQAEYESDQQTINNSNNNNNDNWFNSKESLRRQQAACAHEKDLETMCLTSRASCQLRDRDLSIHLGADCVQRSSMVVDSQAPLDRRLYSSLKSEPRMTGMVNKAYEPGAEDEMASARALTNDIAQQQRLADGFHGTAEKDPVGVGSDQQFGGRPESGLAGRVLKVDLEPTGALNSGACITLVELDDFLAHINPIDMENWYDSSLFKKCLNVIRAPLLFLAILTVPAVDYDKRNNNWCRLLNSLHCITVPLAVSAVLKSSAGEAGSLSLFGLDISVYLLVMGAVLAVTIFRSTNAHLVPRYQPALAYVGFIMSIIWIYMLATEIISLLKTVGIMFNMSDTAIGLGFLAWGNSLGDIVADLTLAEAGHPRMALGASVGAPLLNLLLGFGLSFTLSLKPGGSAMIQYSPTITLLCSTLVIILIILMLATLAPPSQSKKPLGYVLISTYVVYIGIAVCLECDIIKFE